MLRDSYKQFLVGNRTKRSRGTYRELTGMVPTGRNRKNKALTPPIYKTISVTQKQNRQF